VYLKQLISQFAAEFASHPLLEVALAIDDAVQCGNLLLLAREYDA
jgi:hypothetical protein